MGCLSDGALKVRTPFIAWPGERQEQVISGGSSAVSNRAQRVQRGPEPGGLDIDLGQHPEAWRLERVLCPGAMSVPSSGHHENSAVHRSASSALIAPCKPKPLTYTGLADLNSDIKVCLTPQIRYKSPNGTSAASSRGRIHMVCTAEAGAGVRGPASPPRPRYWPVHADPWSIAPSTTLLGKHGSPNSGSRWVSGTCMATLPTRTYPAVIAAPQGRQNRAVSGASGRRTRRLGDRPALSSERRPGRRRPAARPPCAAGSPLPGDCHPQRARHRDGSGS